MSRLTIRHVARSLALAATLPALACAPRATTTTAAASESGTALRNAGIGPLAADRAAVPVRAYEIAYTIGFPQPATHLYEIRIDVGRIDGDAPLDLQLPVWNPGRYARVDFARNVQDFAATGANGATLRWEKTGGSSWRVHRGTADRVRIAYRV